MDSFKNLLGLDELVILPAEKGHVLAARPRWKLHDCLTRMSSLQREGLEGPLFLCVSGQTVSHDWRLAKDV